jgi:N-acyl-L-homoserine lactone synthetase
MNIVIADDAELLEHVYKLRHQVLCEEKRIPGFTNENDSQIEQDEFDTHSRHLLLEHGGKYIGTARIILPSCSEWLVEKYIDDMNVIVDRNTTCEISRFMIISAAQKLPNLTPTLMQGVLQLSRMHNIEHWVCFMSPALNRLLSRYGMQFNQVSECYDVHGMRAAHYISIADMLSRDNCILQ